MHDVNDLRFFSCNTQDGHHRKDCFNNESFVPTNGLRKQTDNNIKYIKLNFFYPSFKYAAVKNGSSCFCLSQVEEKNRLNDAFCNLR